MPVNKTDRLTVIFVIVVVFSLIWLSLGFWDLRQDSNELKTYYKDPSNDTLDLQSAPILESSKIKLIKTDKGIFFDLEQGSGSELDADDLDGNDSAYYLDVSNFDTGVLKTSLYSAIEDLEEEGYVVDGKWVNATYDSSGIDLDLWGGSSRLSKVGTIVSGKWNGDPVTSQYIADKTIELIDLGKNGCTNSQVIKWNDLQDKWVCAADEQSNVGSINWNDIQNRPTGLDDGDDDTVLTEGQVETYIINGAINFNVASQVGGEQIASRNWVTSQGYMTSYTETDPTLSSWTGSSNISAVGTITSGIWSGTAFTSSNIQDGTLTLADLGQNGCAAGQVIKWNDSPAGWICANDLEGVASVDWTSILNRPAGLDDGDDDTVLTEGQVETYVTNSAINLATGSQVNSENIATQNWVGTQGYMTSYTETDPSLASWTGSTNISTVGTITSGTWSGTAFTSSNIQDGSLSLADIGQNGCTDGQVMKWNTGSNSWICSSDISGSGGGEVVYEKWDPDAPPTTPSAYDDEFSDSTLDPSWTSIGTGTVSEIYGMLTMRSNTHYVYKTLPGGDFTIWTKLSTSGSPQLINYSQVTLAVQAGNGTMYTIGITGRNTNQSVLEVIQWSNFLTWVSTPVGYQIEPINYLYTAIKRSGSTLSFWVSTDGISYNRIYTVADPGANRMALLLSGASKASFDFFRYTDSYTDQNWLPPGQIIGFGSGGSAITIGDPINNSTEGSLLFSGSSGALAQDNSNLFWNNTSKRLGIALNTPQHTLHVNGNVGITPSGYINWGDTDGQSGYGIRDNSGSMQYKDSGGTWNNIGGLKSWGRAYGTTDVSKNTSTWEDMPDMTLNMTTQASTVELTFSAGVGNGTASGITSFRLMIDGVIVGTQTKVRVPNITVGSNANLIWIENVTAGPHVFKVQWNNEVGTSYNRASGGTEHRTFIVKEF